MSDLRPQTYGGTIQVKCLTAHNHHRRVHQVGPLEWDDNCHATAQQWAEQLARQAASGGGGNSRGLRHGGMGKGMGQNLWWSADETATPQDAVDAWMREASQYNYADPSKAGHFTQVVWRNTLRVGLGVAVIPRPQDASATDDATAGNKHRYGTFVVANYYPHGNTKGKFQENVFEAQLVKATFSNEQQSIFDVNADDHPTDQDFTTQIPVLGKKYKIQHYDGRNYREHFSTEKGGKAGSVPEKVRRPDEQIVQRVAGHLAPAEVVAPPPQAESHEDDSALNLLFEEDESEKSGVAGVGSDPHFLKLYPSAQDTASLSPQRKDTSTVHVSSPQWKRESAPQLSRRPVIREHSPFSRFYRPAIQPDLARQQGQAIAQMLRGDQGHKVSGNHQVDKLPRVYFEKKRPEPTSRMPSSSATSTLLHALRQKNLCCTDVRPGAQHYQQNIRTSSPTATRTSSPLQTSTYAQNNMHATHHHSEATNKAKSDLTSDPYHISVLAVRKQHHKHNTNNNENEPLINTRNPLNNYHPLIPQGGPQSGGKWGESRLRLTAPHAGVGPALRTSSAAPVGKTPDDFSICSLL